MNTFEDYEYKPLDNLEGSSENVLGNAYLENVGAALTEADLFTKGTYILAQGTGWAIAMHKDPKSTSQWVEVRVMNNVMDAYKFEFNQKKQAWKDIEGEQKPMYDFPVWVAAEAIISGHELFTPSFEKWLWDTHPYLWIDESKAPKF